MHSEIARLSGEGISTEEEIDATCCFATQGKVWVTGLLGKNGRATLRTARARCAVVAPPRQSRRALRTPRAGGQVGHTGCDVIADQPHALDPGDTSFGGVERLRVKADLDHAESYGA